MTTANKDASGGRYIRKGNVVTLQDPDKPGAVVKMCRGSCLVKWPDQPYATPHDCKDLTVVRRINRA